MASTAMNVLGHATNVSSAACGAQAPVYRDAQDVIARLAPEEPHYLLSMKKLFRRANFFLENFPGEVSYAVKSNPSDEIINALYSAGIRAFDVASLNEIAHVHALCPDATLHFNNPIKWRESIVDSYRDFSVRSFVVDDQVGLEQVLRYCSEAKKAPLVPGELEITVRFALPTRSAAFDFASKFGATPDEAVALLKAVSLAGQKCSLTFHPGSQCSEPKVYATYIDTAARLADQAGIDIERLNVGGGFPAEYCNYTVSGLDIFFDEIKNAFQASRFARQASPATLLCEPGRAMVADCVHLLTQVIHKRRDGTVFLNDGVYGSFQEKMVVDFHYPFVCRNQLGKITGEHVTTRVFGPTCDPTDHLGQMALPACIAQGDWIEFQLMGAYSVATATRFNGYFIPQFLAVGD